MDRQVEDVGVVVERLLGAVAVVNVLRSDSDHKCYTLCVCLLKNTLTLKKTAVETDPVHDEDLVDVESLLQQFGCDGHRVEVAETPETAETERESLK